MKTNVEDIRNLEDNFRPPFHFQVPKEVLRLCMAFKAHGNFGVGLVFGVRLRVFTQDASSFH